MPPLDMPVSQLPADEIARRIRAGRELRNIHQADLAKLMNADGIGLHDLGQIERETRTMQLVHQQAILRHLHLPERWLTAESVDEIVGVAVSDDQLLEILGPRLLEVFRGGLPSGEQAPPDQDAQDRLGGPSGATDE